VEAIAGANGITDPAVLQVGQVLSIPGAGEPVVTVAPPGNPPSGGSTPTAVPPPPPPATVGILTLVDKQHALPADYVPPGLTALSLDLAATSGKSLRGEALTALQSMLGAARTAGQDIRAVSAYRSYAEQQSTFQYWVDTLGYDQAIRVSARAGHSEHQLGTTVDLSTAAAGWGLEESFGGTAAGQWLAANGHKYGFALSYPAGGEPVTGYAYEPWHFRYIGKAEASAWKASGLTLNQYLGS
jgi:D-alanyl-D-alanine carboxypeptidase